MSLPENGVLSQFNPSTRDAFVAVRNVIATEGTRIKNFLGVIDIRPGYRFKDGWITDEPAIVVVVRRKLPLERVPENERIPTQIQGIPVEVTSATPVVQLQPESTTRGFAQSLIPPEYQPALPGWELDEERASRSLEYASRAASQPYVPPPGLRLDAVEGAMTVTCHASPDAGWTTLSLFLEKIRHRFTVGMFDFSAPHIRDQSRCVTCRRHC